MAKKMLIDATHPEETRVVVVDGQKVEDFDFESITKRQLAGNIYLAKVTRVEPSLQAAFIEYGGNRHGFLAFSEIHPDYYQIPVADREALLDEERREAEARRARDEGSDSDGSEEGAPKSKRSRGRRRKAPAEKVEAAAVAGLEVIDLDETDAEATDLSEAPAGLEVTDPGATEASPKEALAEDVVATAEETVETTLSEAPELDAEAETETAETPIEPEAETVAEAAEEQTAEAAAQEALDTEAEPVVEEAAEAPESVDEDPSAPPKTMAESAGLEDEDRVTGDVAVADRTKTPADEAPTEHGDASATDTAEPEVAETQPSAEDPVEPPVESNGDADAADAAEPVETTPTAEPAEETTETADAENDTTTDAEGDSESERGGRRLRRRRPRSRKGGDDDATDEDTEEGDVESLGAEDTLEEAARARSRLRRKYKIQDVIKVRQILLVQVVKEERGNKGAALTTYLSLAGRYCVLMPNTARGGGISRKITNAPDRKRLRSVINEMDVPQGMGLIVRTAGAERTRAEIKRDYEFLIRQWEQVRELTLKSVAPTLIYEEGSLIKRSIRDIYSKEIDQILVEGEHGYREAKEYMKMLMPSHAKNVQPYTDPTPLFSRYQVETYLNGMFNPTCQLKSGGYIVIGVTEALVAIDVNSGRATKQGSIEETALQTNLEACDEVARQLRLRDLAGLIVIDFIDMDENRNNRSVEKRMKDRLKNDRARIQVGRISAFGLMEMSRQRLRPGMLEATTQPCPHCMGTGLIRSDENLSLSILREVEEEALRGRSDQITVRAPLDVANYLINHKRPHIAQLEERHGIDVIVLADPTLTSPNFVIERSKSATPRPQRQTDVVTSASVVSDDVEEAEVVETDESPADRDDDGRGGRRRRGKRGGRKRRPDGEEGDVQTAEGDADTAEREETDEENRGRSRGRRNRNRRRGGRGKSGGTEAETQSEEATAEGEEPEIDEAPATDAEEAPAEPSTPEPAPEPASTEPEEPKRKRRGWWSFGG